jgi:hypothetical protein
MTRAAGIVVDKPAAGAVVSCLDTFVCVCTRMRERARVRKETGRVKHAGALGVGGECVWKREFVVHVLNLRRLYDQFMFGVFALHDLWFIQQ